MKRLWFGALAALVACGDGGGRTPGEMVKSTQLSGPAGMVTLTGAGATFPMPIYSRWFATYARANPVRVNYASVGSGAGIRQITQGTVDFGASDAPMTDEELARKPGILHVPMVMGSVAVSYNLPGLRQPLRLDGATLAAIYLGQVRRWNDPRIAALNPGVALPGADILPVYRTDGSGTTFVFTDFLSAVSPAWKGEVGVGKSVKWPTGLGAKGNEGVTGAVRQAEGAVGYVEVAYATQNRLPVASMRNAAGAFVTPSVEATTEAAAAVVGSLPADTDFRLSIVNAAAPGAYPIASFTYLLVPTQIGECVRARALTGLVHWTLTAGGDMARRLEYAPLPPALRDRVIQRLGTVTCGPGREPAGPRTRATRTEAEHATHT